MLLLSFRMHDNILTAKLFVCNYSLEHYFLFIITYSHKDNEMGIADNRKIFIREHLAQKGVVQVGELAIALKVSEMTIRRDLSDLEKEGVLKRTHGGAVQEVGRSFEPSFDLRQTVHQVEKLKIAETAALHVEEGDTIAIDSGTTAIELAKQLLAFRNLTIVTPSLHVAILFLDHPSIEPILSGGRVRKSEGSLVGEITWATFSNLFFDKFFMSSGCLSAFAGFTEYNADDAAIKKMIISHSKETIALIDSSKFGRTAFSQVCPNEDVNILVAEKDPDQKLKNALLKSEVKIEIAKTRRKK
jgi:DeoR/GlpR family transcriptional regulator of sugar metabolism